MILVYGFVAFLFFKIFPEFAGYQSNTVVGALVMAATSAIVLQVGEWAAAWRIGVWVQTAPHEGQDAPSGLWLVATAAVAGSIGATFLVGVGFSDGMMRSAFKGFRAEPVMFWVMAALPPLVHISTRVPVFLLAAREYRKARRETSLKS